MIIFDFNCLADDSHRRHFIEPPENDCGLCYDYLTDIETQKDCKYVCMCGRKPADWRLDYSAYEAAAVHDKPIKKPIYILNVINPYKKKIFLWSSRHLSTKEQINKWILDNVCFGNFITLEQIKLKMRPDEDDTPQELLFEGWLFDLCEFSGSDKGVINKHPIDIVFSSHKPTIDMFRRIGVFVFDCNQGN